MLTSANICFVGWGPYAYFRVLEESLVNRRVPDAANTRSTQLGVTQSEPQQNDRNSKGVASNDASTHQTVEDLESGRS